VRAESNRRCVERRSGTSLTFCTRCVRAIRSKPPCVDRGCLLLVGQRFTDHCDAHKHLSPYAVTGITLWKLIDCGLIRSWNLKWIVWNARYLHVSLIWLTGRYKPYAFDSIHPLGVDQKDCLMLSWGGASDQIENMSSLAGDLSFLLFGLKSPFDLCYWVRRPQLRERSAKCLMI
jgi:hypothetical protein